MMKRRRNQKKPPPERAAFGARLREARERAGLGPLEVARLMGAAPSTYYSWETGDRVPRDPRRLAAIVGTTVGGLHGEVPL